MDRSGVHGSFRWVWIIQVHRGWMISHVRDQLTGSIAPAGAPTWAEEADGLKLDASKHSIPRQLYIEIDKVILDRFTVGYIKQFPHSSKSTLTNVLRWASLLARRNIGITATLQAESKPIIAIWKLLFHFA